MPAMVPAPNQETDMFNWTIALFVIAIVAAIFGFGGIAASAAGAAKIVFFIAIILAVLSFFTSRGRNVGP